MSDTPVVQPPDDGVRSFVVHETRHDKPLAFDLTDDRGEYLGRFRFMSKPRLDVVQAMTAAIQVDSRGQRVQNLDLVRFIIEEVLLHEEWDAATGQWVPADDRDRFRAVMTSDRWSIDASVLNELVMWMTRVVLGMVPTGGPKASSPGPDTTPHGSTDDSPSPEPIPIA